MAISEEAKAEICAKLASGVSLVQALKADGMPSRAVFYVEMASDKDLQDRYARAKQAGLEAMAEDIIAISDETEVQDVYDADGNLVEVRMDNTAVQRNRLRVDSRKWLLSKLAPKKYGDKIEHEHKGGMTVTLLSTDERL